MLFFTRQVAAKIVFSSLLLTIASARVVAQTGKDVCHVYVLDVAKVQEAFDNFHETGDEEADARALSVGQTLFPEFRPVIGEEELTTKHYPFPGSRLVITASVFYTDESMASHPHGQFETHSESMLIGVTVSGKEKPNAVSADAGESAIAEVTYDEYTNKVRAKKYLKVNGRSFLVGIECDCMAGSMNK